MLGYRGLQEVDQTYREVLEDLSLLMPHGHEVVDLSVDFGDVTGAICSGVIVRCSCGDSITLRAGEMALEMGCDILHPAASAYEYAKMAILSSACSSAIREGARRGA